MTIKQTSLVLNCCEADDESMTTRRRPHYSSFGDWAASLRRGYLAGGAGSTTLDRDLDRVGHDLQAASQVDRTSLVGPGTSGIAHPVDLHARRERATQSLPARSTTAPSARAS